MTCEIYWGSGSAYSWSVLLALEIKGVDYESRRVDMSKGEHKTPAYLAMNPRGKVPVLKDDTAAVYESTAILAYLDQKYPEPPLFGTKPAQTGHIWQTVFEVVNYVLGPVYDIVLPIFFGKTDEQGETIAAAIPKANEEFAIFEQRLAGSPYLVGDSLSAADVVFFPVVQVLLRATGKETAAAFDLKFLPLEQHYPNIARWVQRIEALPGYDNTYPPHWRS